jgi:glycerol kinase
MRFTSPSRSENFHSAEREMSKSYFPGIDTSTTSSQALLVDESGNVMSNFYGHPSRNSSQNLLLCDKHCLWRSPGLTLR